MLTSTRDVEVIADHINPEQQGWTREVTVRTMGHKVRASIYRDSYDFQSRIKVEVWADAALKWNTVRTLSGKDHGDLPGAYTLKHSTHPESEGKALIFGQTAELVDELIGYAQEVLA